MKNEAESQAVFAVSNVRNVRGRAMLPGSTVTHLGLASFLWDIGKQKSPRCDAAKRGVPSGTILFAYIIVIKKEIKNEK